MVLKLWEKGSNKGPKTRRFFEGVETSEPPASWLSFSDVEEPREPPVLGSRAAS